MSPITVFKKQSRVVSFRVSDEEYEGLMRASQEQGAHSVSDYARWMARRGIGESDGHAEESLFSEMRHISTRVEELSRELVRLKLLLRL